MGRKTVPNRASVNRAEDDTTALMFPFPFLESVLYNRVSCRSANVWARPPRSEGHCVQFGDERWRKTALLGGVSVEEFPAAGAKERSGSCERKASAEGTRERRS